eukprot:GHVL01004117.1.p1 GENE.GHVL01004117.1~~GHVL01004117.1.p1  ORF type:complete len:310 (-),score=23.67 GHVL01004117.1:973-1902(-)
MEPILETWDEWKGDIPFYQHAFCGSVAGFVEHISMHPVDTLKTNLQALSRTSGDNPGVVSVFRSIIATNGVSALFRGAPIIATASIPAHAAFFGVYEWGRTFLGIKDGHCDPLKASICGGASVLCHDCIMTPMDVIKQRLQLGCYRTTWDCVTNTVRVEGLQALFRSVPTTLGMNIPYGAILVSCNESLKSVLYQERLPDLANLYLYFVSAGLSAVLAAAMTNPLDVVKTRLQTQDLLLRPNFNFDSIKYKNFLTTTLAIWKEAGMAGFFRGCIPRMTVNAPSAAICWGTYESLKHLLFSSKSTFPLIR